MRHRALRSLCLALGSGLTSLAAAEPALAEPAAPAPASSPLLAAPRPLTPQPYEFQPGVICPLCELTPQFPRGRSGLHWHDHWSTVGTRELLTIGALGAAALGLQLFFPPPAESHWNSPILFDDPARSLLRVDSASGRRTASTVSDGLFIWEILHPSVLDPLLVAWWQRESPFVAWQMLVIDAQAYSMTLLLNQLVKRLVARSRPWVGVEDCAENPGGEQCGSGGANVSFYSGHAAMTATSAGLMCAHHTQLSLYQSHLLDTGVCALAVAGTAVTGALRIASDNHWASDVLIGHLMGYASGYLLPTLLYYKEFRTTPHEHPTTPTYAALPLITGDALGVSVLGVF